MICDGCKKQVKAKATKAGSERLPRGWHRAKGLFCDVCWADRYMLRTITMEVAEPLSGTWQELRAAATEMWKLTTQMSNWMATELYARDVRRNGEAKMPAMPHAYLYPQARERFPNYPPQSVASLEQMVQRKYRAKRYEVIWTCAASLPTFRYPTPFPVHNQAWSAEIDGQCPVVLMRIADSKWCLRLKGSARYRRQIAAFNQMVSGEAVRGQAEVLKHSDGTILIKMVAWIPRPERREYSGVLRVRSTKESLLVALNEKDEKLWIYNADHLVRWQTEHKKKLQRWAEDQKAEQRPVPTFAERRTHAVTKQHDRMHSAIQQIAASLVHYAIARRFAEIRYDDSDKSFCESFPWYALADRIFVKAKEYGVKFTLASGDAEVKTPEPLADENT